VYVTLDTLHWRYTLHFDDAASFLTCIPQAGANGEVGYSIFKLMSAIPIVGVSAIRAIEIFSLSRSISLTVCVAVISVMSTDVPLAAMSLFHTARTWVTGLEREEVNGVDPTLLPDQTDLREGHFVSTQVKWVLYWQGPPQLTSLLGQASIHPRYHVGRRA